MNKKTLTKPKNLILISATFFASTATLAAALIFIPSSTDSYDIPRPPFNEPTGQASSEAITVTNPALEHAEQQEHEGDEPIIYAPPQISDSEPQYNPRFEAMMKASAEQQQNRAQASHKIPSEIDLNADDLSPALQEWIDAQPTSPSAIDITTAMSAYPSTIAETVAQSVANGELTQPEADEYLNWHSMMPNPLEAPELLKYQLQFPVN